MLKDTTSKRLEVIQPSVKPLFEPIVIRTICNQTECFEVHYRYNTIYRILKENGQQILLHEVKDLEVRKAMLEMVMQ